MHIAPDSNPAYEYLFNYVPFRGGGAMAHAEVHLPTQLKCIYQNDIMMTRWPSGHKKRRSTMGNEKKRGVTTEESGTQYVKKSKLSKPAK